MAGAAGGAFNPSFNYKMSGQGGVSPAVVEITANAALPIFHGTIILSKASAALCTLAAPTSAQEGFELTITSATAAAHVITATALLADAVTGSPHTTATFAAFKGATITLVACKGLLSVKAATGVPVT